jgi:anti-sigma B factor antagonist
VDITTRSEGDIAIINVAGKLDTTTAAEFDARLREVAGTAANHCILAFDKLDYISSAGLRSVLMAAKQFGTKKGKLALSGLNGPVREVFALSGFDRVVKLHTTEAEAVAGIRQG